MKRRGMLALLSSTVAVTFLATVLSTIAWFNTTINVSPEDKLSGFSDGAYFAGGDGLTAETAFIIRTPRHLYNLAWLQYLGYFNEDKKNNTTGAATPDNVIDQQYYFILDNDLDMNPGDSAKTQWCIPPIGTQKYPFVGTFIGNNKTITDLQISNLFSDYNKTPSSIKSSSDIKDLNIVGFFGVVGTLSSDENSSSITSGTANYTYDKSANSVSNLGLDNLEVKSTSGNLLIGLAAGYVNGSVNGVAIKSSKITTTGNTRLSGFGTSTNLSDYSVAGYVRPKYLGNMLQHNITAKTPEVTNDVISGSGDEFGASIAMETMYTRLLNKYQEAGTKGNIYKYTSSETRYGSQTGSETSTEYKYDDYNYRYNSEVDDQGHTISQFTYWQANSERFMYLHGDETVQKNKTVYSYNKLTSISNNTTFYISDGKGNYLTASENGTLNTKTAANATTFTYNNGRISYRYSSGWSQTTYYLKNNNGSLSITNSTSNLPAWTINTTTGQISSQYNNETYYISCANSNWTLTTGGITTKHILTDSEGHCISFDGTNVYLISTDEAAATDWTWSGSYYYPSSRSDLGLVFYSTSYKFIIYYANQSSNYYTLNGQNLSSRYNNTPYYVYYSGGNNPWSTTTDSNQASNISYKELTVDTSEYINLEILSTNRTTTTEQVTFNTNPTYMPLSYVPIEDAQGKVTGYETKVSPKNTGYMVSGTSLGGSGDIRVSQYYMSDLKNSFNANSYNAEQTNIVTIDSQTGSYKLIEDEYNANNSTSNISDALAGEFGRSRTSFSDLGLQKYKASRKQLHNLFNNKNNIYGLHFMNANISDSNTVRIPWALINDTEYPQYQLPRDCIDFNLKNHGIVNFFAGSYFSGNETFFSLHNIERDPETNDISSIKEISKIYQNTGDNRKIFKYIYEYDDGTLNTYGGTYDSNNPIFNMEWVTSPTMVDNALYYYEIPVNKGEYALGSAGNKTGAYLIYLDIGAAVKTKNITTYTEQITTITNTYNYVKGIDFVDTIPENAENFLKINGSAVANITLPASTNGSTTFLYNDTNKTLICNPPNNVSLGASYIKYGVTVSVTGSDSPNPNSISSTTEVLDKVTTITYDNDAETIVKLVSTRINGGNWVDGEPTIIEEGVQEYTAAATISSAGLDIVHFHYQTTSEASVTIDTDYNSETDTYTINLTSSEATTIYIDSVLASATVDGVTVNYTVIINGVTVTTGCNPIPVSKT